MSDRLTVTVHPTGEELFKVWAAVEPVVEGMPINVVIPALLAMCITAQKPDIDDETLREGVKGASQWIALFLSDSSIPKEQMN